MKICLSIIIPNYNHAKFFPKLLDSVLNQSFKDHEIIIVDDCSDIPISYETINAYIDKGLKIKIINNKTRKYTKESRLIGVEASKGDYITFIDADDSLYGTKALEEHILMLKESGADLLHFNVAIYKDNKIWSKMFEANKPIANNLLGDNIFNEYVESGMLSHLVYGKIASRSLWEKCIKPARYIEIRRYQEDLLLASLLFFHSQKYIGSDRIGYRRDYIEKSEQKACGRAVANYLMLKKFIPYILENGAAHKSAEKMLNFFFNSLRHNLMVFLTNASENTDEESLEKSIGEINEHTEMDEFIKLILSSKIFSS